MLYTVHNQTCIESSKEVVYVSSSLILKSSNFLNNVFLGPFQDSRWLYKSHQKEAKKEKKLLLHLYMTENTFIS